MSAPSPAIEATIATFIARGSAAQSAERANYAMFLAGCTEKQRAKIRALAEELDTCRKRAQQQHGLGRAHPGDTPGAFLR